MTLNTGAASLDFTRLSGGSSLNSAKGRKGFNTSRMWLGSEAGQEIGELLDSIEQNDARTVSMYPRSFKYESLLEELRRALTECSVADWDGYEADPICPNSAKYASQFLKLIFDEGLPLPDDCLPEPSGYLALDWCQNGYDVALSISSDKQIEWGGISPNGHVWGDVEYNENDKIPLEVVALLEAIASKS